MMISNLNLAKLPECVCEMRYIDSALLTPCAEYQRVLRTRKVEEISATFSEYVANEPRVSYRDGRYHVFDGQNTIEARIACNGGHDLPILCKVFHGLSKKDEALLFAVQTGISTDLTAGERLRADIVAEDEDAGVNCDILKINRPNCYTHRDRDNHHTERTVNIWHRLNCENPKRSLVIINSSQMFW